MLGANGSKELDSHPPQWPFEKVRSLISADYAIGNAEGPISSRKKRHFAKQKWHYNAPVYQADVLAEVGFRAMGLANNHLLDRGPKGVRDTFRALERVGIVAFGAGTTPQAAAPLILETPYGKVGVVAFSVDHRGRFLSSESDIGLRPLAKTEFERGVKSAREEGAKWVVAFVHWGSNYAAVNDSQRRQARELVAAGVDLVIGHHPHVVQKVERIDGVLVFYSLGNFVFSTTGRFTLEHQGRGLVVRSVLGPSGFDRFELRCIVTDNLAVNFQPVPCDQATSENLMRELGEQVEMRGLVGTISASK